MASNNPFAEPSASTKTINRIWQMVQISLIFTIFSLPVITFGASFAATSYTIRQVMAGNDKEIFKEFWGCFKKKFKQATLTWLIYGIEGFIACFDVYHWLKKWANAGQGVQSGQSVVTVPMLIMSIIVLYLYLLLTIHVFPLIGNFEGKSWPFTKDAFFSIFGAFSNSFIMILLIVSAAWFAYVIPLVLILFAVIGFGAMGFLMEGIRTKVFRVMEQNRETDEEFEARQQKALEAKRNAFNYTNKETEDDDEE